MAGWLNHLNERMVCAVIKEQMPHSGRKVKALRSPVVCSQLLAQLEIASQNNHTYALL